MIAVFCIKSLPLCQPAYYGLELANIFPAAAHPSDISYELLCLRELSHFSQLSSISSSESNVSTSSPRWLFFSVLAVNLLGIRTGNGETTAQTNLAIEEPNRFRGTESKLLENTLSLILYLRLYPRVYDR